MDQLHQHNDGLGAFTRRLAYPEVANLPTLSTVFCSKESVSTKANTESKVREFKLWKAGASGFSWKLFAISQAHSDELRQNPRRAAMNVFRTFAGEVIREKGWRTLHGGILWTNLPEKYKKHWKAAEMEVQDHAASEPSPSACSAADTPRFTEDAPFNNGNFSYFTFKTEAGPSSTSVVHADLEPARKILPIPQRTQKARQGGVVKSDLLTEMQTRAPTAQTPRHSEDPNPHGTLLPGTTTIDTTDMVRVQGTCEITPAPLVDLSSFIDLFDGTQQDVDVQGFFEAPNTASGSVPHLSSLDDFVAELEALSRTTATRAPSPTLGLATGFDFREIFPSIDNPAYSQASHLPPSLKRRPTRDRHDWEEESNISLHTEIVPSAQKRRKGNPCHPLHYSSIQGPCPPALSQTSDFLGLDVPFIGGESGHQVSQQGVRSNYDLWPPVEAPAASSSAVQPPTPTCGPSFDPDFNLSCITTPEEGYVGSQDAALVAMLEPGLSTEEYARYLEELLPEMSALDTCISAAQ